MPLVSHWHTDDNAQHIHGCICYIRIPYNTYYENGQIIFHYQFRYQHLSVCYDGCNIREHKSN